MNTRRVRRRDSTDDLSTTLNGQDDLYVNRKCIKLDDESDDEHYMMEESDGKVKRLLILLVSPMVVYAAAWFIASMLDVDIAV